MVYQTAKRSNCESTPSDPTAVVLLADAFQESGIEYLETLGCVVTCDPSLKNEELILAIENVNPDILVVRSTKVTKEMMESSERLSLIIRAGAGYDTIDVNAASSRGISIANCPGKNSIAVAELAWGLIVSCDRRIPDQAADLLQGKWNKKEYSKASGLFGRTIGVVGVGGIGLEVIQRAKAFGMNVVAWSRSLTVEKAESLGVDYCESLQHLAKMSDVVSVHVSSTPETKKLIGKQFLSSMKNNAIFINTSRGKVVDEKALVEAINNKGLRVGLDVFESEPTAGDNTFSSEIVQSKHVYGTHHVGASTNQAQESIATEVVRIITNYIERGKVLNCVNQAINSTSRAILSVRHKNLPGVLSHVFEELSNAGVNVEEMENVLYEGGLAACARIQLSATPTSEQIDFIKNNENIFSVTLTA
jgi:D-3-phosphoglycerate dehydrogenase